MDFNRQIDKAFLIEDTLWKFYSTSNHLKALVNNEGYFVHVNRAFKQALGYSFKELTTKPFIEFIHPEDIEKTMQAYDKTGHGQKTLETEFTNRYVCKDGKYITLIWLIDDMQFNGLSLASARII